MPEGAISDETSSEGMLPPAEKMRTLTSAEEARALLAADKQLALDMLDRAAQEMEKAAPAPWDPTPTPLDQRLLQMVEHLSTRKGQLFYYPKL